MGENWSFPSEMASKKMIFHSLDMVDETLNEVK